MSLNYKQRINQRINNLFINPLITYLRILSNLVMTCYSLLNILLIIF